MVYFRKMAVSITLCCVNKQFTTYSQIISIVCVLCIVAYYLTNYRNDAYVRTQ